MFQLLQCLDEDEFARRYRLAFRLNQVHMAMDSYVWHTCNTCRRVIFGSDKSSFSAVLFWLWVTSVSQYLGPLNRVADLHGRRPLLFISEIFRHLWLWGDSPNFRNPP